MRSYHKVFALPDFTALSARLDPGFQEKPFYVQVVIRSRKVDIINGYNFLGSVAFAQMGGNFTPHWATFDSNGTLQETFSGEQLAGIIFPVRNYAGHPLN
jgi:hypothetical protein